MVVAASTATAAAGYRQFLSELRPTLKSGLFREILSQWKNMDRPTDRPTTTAEASPPPVASVFNATERMAWWFFFLFFFQQPRRRYLRDLRHGWPRVQFVCVRVRKVTMRRGIFEHAQPSIRPRAFVIILPLCFTRDTPTNNGVTTVAVKSVASLVYLNVWSPSTMKLSRRRGCGIITRLAHFYRSNMRSRNAKW